jgi:hypothetical protein
MVSVVLFMIPCSVSDPGAAAPFRGFSAWVAPATLCSTPSFARMLASRDRAGLLSSMGHSFEVPRYISARRSMCGGKVGMQFGLRCQSDPGLSSADAEPSTTIYNHQTADDNNGETSTAKEQGMRLETWGFEPEARDVEPPEGAEANPEAMGMGRWTAPPLGESRPRHGEKSVLCLAVIAQTPLPCSARSGRLPCRPRPGAALRLIASRAQLLLTSECCWKQVAEVAGRVHVFSGSHDGCVRHWRSVVCRRTPRGRGLRVLGGHQSPRLGQSF